MLDAEQKREIERQSILKAETNSNKVAELQTKFDTERQVAQERIKATIKSHKDEIQLANI